MISLPLQYNKTQPEKQEKKSITAERRAARIADLETAEAHTFKQPKVLRGTRWLGELGVDDQVALEKQQDEEARIYDSADEMDWWSHLFGRGGKGGGSEIWFKDFEVVGFSKKLEGKKGKGKKGKGEGKKLPFSTFFSFLSRGPRAH